MESVKETLFEDPFYLYVLLAIAAVVCLGVWRSRRKAKWLLMIGVLVLLAGGFYFLERAIVTDRERIWAALDAMAAAAEKHDVDTLTGYLDDNYRGWRLGKITAVAAAKLALRRWQIHKVKFMERPKVAVSGDSADSTVRVVFHYDGQKRHPMGWEVEWVRRPDGWRVRHATPLDNPLP